MVSYDPRFVLLCVRCLCVWGGGGIVRVSEWLPSGGQGRIRLPLAVVALVWALYIAWIGIEYKGSILGDPFMSDAAKHIIVLSGK